MNLILILIYVIFAALNIILYRKSSFVRNDAGWLGVIKVFTFIPIFNIFSVILIMLDLITDKVVLSDTSLSKLYNKIFGD